MINTAPLMPSLEFRIQDNYHPRNHEIINNPRNKEFVYDLLHTDGARYHTKGFLWSKIEVLPIIPSNPLEITNYSLSQLSVLDFIRHPLNYFEREIYLRDHGSELLRGILENTEKINLTFRTRGREQGKQNLDELRQTIQLPAQTPSSANSLMHQYTMRMNDLFEKFGFSLPYFVTPSLNQTPKTC